MLKNKKILITGGTGSFGNAFLDSILDQGLDEIRIFSRDEKKQDDMRVKYNNPLLKFYIGDVRDQPSIENALKNIDYCFHAAALKQVPSCEFFPMEAYKTNVIGTENVIKAVTKNSVSKLICLSTDKAVYPINAMGISKAMMEKLLLAEARTINSKISSIAATRYGNVMASRGSVIPLFINQIQSGLEITITDPKMTRFMMSLEEAVLLVKHSFINAENGDIFVRKSPAVTIENLVYALCEVMNKPKHPVRIIGTRHGEKLFESLLSREEMALASDDGDYFRIPMDNRDHNYTTFIAEGNENVTEAYEYSSHNTEQLSVNEMIKLLKNLPYIQSFL